MKTESEEINANKEVAIDDCYFYHTCEIPGHGLVKGEWDLRGSESEYLGDVDFNVQRHNQTFSDGHVWQFYTVVGRRSPG